MLRLAYIPCKNTAEAESIARTLVERKLVACGNILPAMRSVYRWEGKIETSEEVLLLLKTIERHMAAVTDVVEELHSYDTPCILWLPPAIANDAYQAWVRENVASTGA